MEAFIQERLDSLSMDRDRVRFRLAFQTQFGDALARQSRA
jgi:hypothetical protein